MCYLWHRSFESQTSWLMEAVSSCPAPMSFLSNPCFMTYHVSCSIRYWIHHFYDDHSHPHQNRWQPASRKGKARVLQHDTDIWQSGKLCSTLWVTLCSIVLWHTESCVGCRHLGPVPGSFSLSPEYPRVVGRTHGCPGSRESSWTAGWERQLLVDTAGRIMENNFHFLYLLLGF